MDVEGIPKGILPENVADILSPKQALYHEYVAMGITSNDDIALAEGVTGEAVSQWRHGSQRLLPESEVAVEKLRTRRAAELHKLGLPWNEVADALQYKSGDTARDSVKRLFDNNPDGWMTAALEDDEETI